MRNFTLLILTAFAALTLSAAPTRRDQKKQDNRPTTQTPVRQLKSPLTALTKANDKIRFVKSKTVIKDRPEGEHKYCFQWGNGFQLFDDMLFDFPTNTVGEIVRGDNNQFYMRNAIASFTEAGWVRGTLSDDGKKITMQFPQHVDDREGTDEEGKTHNVQFYVSLMKYNAETNDYELIDQKDNVVTYTIDDNGKIVMDGAREFEYDYDPETEESTLIMPDTMLTCYYEYDPYGDGVMHQYWYGHSVIAQEFTPLPDDLIINEYPTGLNYELWGMTDSNGTEKSVEVAMAGNDIFIRGIDDTTPECIVKGTIDGDKATFPSKQFFGINSYGDAFIFFMGCTYGWAWFEEFQDYYEGYIIADKLEMDYDAATKTLTAADTVGFVINAEIENIRYYSAYLAPRFFAQDASALNAAPQDPTLNLYERIEDYGQDFFSWNLSNKNVNDAFIDVNNVYYNAFVNDELYTFTPEQYYYVLEPITDLPYNYSDDNRYDIYCDGTEHNFYIPFEGLNKFGIKMYYTAPDGKLYSSKRVTYNIAEDKIETDDESAITAPGSEPARMDFTNLQGMKVSKPVAGNIYLRTVTFKDGSKQTVKFIAR